MSAKELSPELIALSEKIVEKLKISRQQGRVTPDHPITAREICNRMKARGIEITDIDVREMFNYQRQLGRWVATHQSGKGYFWAISPGEMKHTLHSLRGRRNKIDKAIRGIEKGMQETL